MIREYDRVPDTTTAQEFNEHYPVGTLFLHGQPWYATRVHTIGPAYTDTIGRTRVTVLYSHSMGGVIDTPHLVELTPVAHARQLQRRTAP